MPADRICVCVCVCVYWDTYKCNHHYNNKTFLQKETKLAEKYVYINLLVYIVSELSSHYHGMVSDCGASSDHLYVMLHGITQSWSVFVDSLSDNVSTVSLLL